MLAGVDLDAVAACLHRQLGRACEPGDDGGDVVGLHHLRDLARVHLRHPGRGEERRLAVRARPLPTGVVERGEDQRTVRVARRCDLRPAVGAPLGQRRALVRPVAAVHARSLDDDRAAAATGAGGVVRDVPLRQAAIVVAEVRDVRAEQQAVRRRGGADVERLEEPHRQLATGCSTSTGITRAVFCWYSWNCGMIAACASNSRSRSAP